MRSSHSPTPRARPAIPSRGPRTPCRPASALAAPDVAGLEAELSPAQLEEARRIASAARAVMSARSAGFAAEPPEEALSRLDSAGGAVRFVAIDDLRECERNLVGNCRG